MIPVDQEFLVGDGSGRLGDCLRACVASILELPAGDVPHFVEENDWLGSVRGFLGTQDRGLSQGGPTLEFFMLNPDRDPRYPLLATPARPIEYVIALGPSPRGVTHAVVVDQATGLLAHDPHPSRDGLAGEPRAVLVVAL